MRDIDGRIYLAEVNAILTMDERLLSIEETMTLIAELKRCYELIDRYDCAVSTLADGEDDTGCGEDLTVVRLTACRILYNLRDLK